MNDIQAIPAESFEAAFAYALFEPDEPPPAAIDASRRQASRFDVYRNNVVVSLINALASRYPVVRRLLWDEGFNTVARLYIEQAPPRSPVLLEYGDGFPAFVRNFGMCPARDYVADVAELETARVRAYHAPDVVALNSQAFAGLEAAELARLRVVFHPSVTLLKSRFPIVTIWEAQQADGGGYLREWKQESALIARPQLDVEVSRLPAGSYEFLSALACGITVGAAIERAQTNSAEFDLGASLAVLIGRGIAVALVATEA
jgi:hypothetical protein